MRHASAAVAALRSSSASACRKRLSPVEPLQVLLDVGRLEVGALLRDDRNRAALEHVVQLGDQVVLVVGDRAALAGADLHQHALKVGQLLAVAKLGTRRAA
jgi:hypothetical protein